MDTIMKQSFVYGLSPLLLEKKGNLAQRGFCSIVNFIWTWKQSLVWQLKQGQILLLEHFDCWLRETEYQLWFFIIIFEMI